MINPMNLNSEVKKKALEELKKLYPNGKIIYEHWQNCLSAYQSGYWAAPDDFDNVLRDCEPGKLGICLSIYNSSIICGYCRDWVRMISRYFVEPQYCAFLELVMACSPVTDVELWYNAKGKISNGKRPTISQPDMYSYAIEEGELRKWLDEVEPGKNHPYYVTVDDHTDDAIDIIASLHIPSDLRQFENCDEVMKLFEEGYIAGIKDCALNWKNAYVTDQILDELKQLNNLLCEGIPISGLRHVVLPDIPADVRPFFTLILDAAEAEHNREEADSDV